MSRYVTTEDMYHCFSCELVCAERELKQSDYEDTVLRCPRCGYARWLQVA